MTAPVTNRALVAARRGDTLKRSFTVSSDWDPSIFDEVIFTLRTKIPPSTQTSDDDATVVYQGRLSAGDIAFVGQVGTLTVQPAVTTHWPATTLHFDVQAIAASESYTLESGKIEIVGDITRSAS